MNPSTLGAHCAKPQPNHTAEVPAHDAIHPLDSAPLPQRWPWALLSARAIFGLWMPAIAACASTWIYADTASSVPFPLNKWLITLAFLWSVLFVAYVAAAILIMVCIDARAESIGGPDADSSR